MPRKRDPLRKVLLEDEAELALLSQSVELCPQVAPKCGVVNPSEQRVDLICHQSAVRPIDECLARCPHPVIIAPREPSATHASTRSTPESAADGSVTQRELDLLVHRFTWGVGQVRYNRGTGERLSESQAGEAHTTPSPAPSAHRRSRSAAWETRGWDMAPWSMREGSSPHEPVLDQATIELCRREAGRIRAQAEPRPTATSRRRKPAFRRSLPHTDGRFGADGITAEVAAGARREPDRQVALVSSKRRSGD